jgi:hypothetical protein
MLSFRRRDASGEFSLPRQESRFSLHSVCGVSGFHIQALDGRVGRIEDVIADDEVWAIRYLAVDATEWIGGTMLVPPALIRRVNWTDRVVHMDGTREDLETSRQCRPAMDMESAPEERRRA